MSHLQYYSYDGVGQRNKQKFWYSQAVCIGDRIECAGQGVSDTAEGHASPPKSTLTVSQQEVGTQRLE